MLSALAALQQPGPGQGPGGPDPRREAIKRALADKIARENLMGQVSQQDYDEAVEYYYKNNTMPVVKGAESGQTPPQNPDQPASAPTPTGPGIMDRVGSAIGRMIAHPIDTGNEMINSMAGTLGTAVMSSDPKIFAQQMAAPYMPSEVKPYLPKAPPTDAQRALAMGQIAATAATGPISKFATGALGPLAGEAATGAGLGALWTPQDPIVGGIVGGIAGGVGAKAGEALRAREGRLTPKAAVPNEAPTVPPVPGSRPTPSEIVANAPPISPDALAANEALTKAPRSPDVVNPAVADMEIPAGVKTPAGLNMEEAAPAKEFGGEKVDFSKIDPQVAGKLQETWGNLTPNKRASLLGDKVMKAVMGEKPDARVVAAINQADITKLPGYMQRGLLRSVGAEEGATKGVTPRKGKMTPAQAPASSVTPSADVAPPQVPTPASETPGPVTAEAQPTSPVSKRQGKLKRADLLRDAPRTPDGMIDWDRLTSAQREAASQTFGKDYRQKVQTMSLAQMQAVLKPGQMDVIIKQLSRPPKAEVSAETAATAAATPGVEAPGGAPASAPDVVEPSAVSRRGKMTPVEPEEPVTTGRVSAPAEPVIAATEKPSGLSPAGYDKLSPANKKAILSQIMKARQIPGDVDLLAQHGFADLPPIYRREIPTMKLPTAGEPVGGAAEEAAGFPGPKRRPRGKRK